jgi:phytoene dehydrogenase-like protein
VVASFLNLTGGAVNGFLPTIVQQQTRSPLSPAGPKEWNHIPNVPHSPEQQPTTCLNLLNFFGRGKKNTNSDEGDTKEGGKSDDNVVVDISNTQDGEEYEISNMPILGGKTIMESDIVIVGGGVSGLAAAITAAEAAQQKKVDCKIILVEAHSKLGGRVASIRTDDGFVLDEGFAVFIEEYPAVKQLLDYDALSLKPFLPGALVKLRDNNRLARVADPLRVPADTINSILSPVGSLIDKIEVLPLIFNVRVKTIEALFEEAEVDTETALIERWKFSDDFINNFYKPFLEGIYLAPLSQQSSRMFSFIFKMFSEGSATLPKGGMQTISDQLEAKAKALGVEIFTDTPATKICISSKKGGDDSGMKETYVVECAKNRQRFESATLIVATDGQVAQKIISNFKGFESLEELVEQPQRSVGCLYYSFKGEAPIEEPILILNGIGDESGNEKNPVNNVCFPSVVNDGYAPEGYGLCSVTVLSKAMEIYKDRPDDLDQAVRRQLGTWFRDQRSDILDKWELKKIFFVSIDWFTLSSTCLQLFGVCGFAI